MGKLAYIIAFLFVAGSSLPSRKPKDPPRQRARSSHPAIPIVTPQRPRPLSQAQMVQFFTDLHAEAAGWKTQLDRLAPSWQDTYITGQAVQAGLKGASGNFNSILQMTSPSRLKLFTPPRSPAFDLNYEHNLQGFLIAANEHLSELSCLATQDPNLGPHVTELANLTRAVANSRRELGAEISLRILELAYPPQTKHADKKRRKGP